MSSIPRRHPGLAAAFAAFWSALAAALSAWAPLAAPLLLPFGAARFASASFAAEGPLVPFLAAVLTVPGVLLFSIALSLAIAPTGGLAAVILALVGLVLPALALVAGAREGRRRDHLTILVAATTGIGALAVLLGATLAFGKDPGSFLATRFTAQIPELVTTYRASGWSESSLQTFGRICELIRLALQHVLPGIVLSGSVLYAALLVYPFGGLSGVDRRELTDPSFSKFSTPAAAAVLFVPAGLAAALGASAWKAVAVDVLLPLAALFFLRGLAIIRALLDRGKAGPLGRALVYALVIQMPFPMLLALGGLFDEFLNFRGRLERIRPEGGDEA
jgi:hypothetical protein